MKQIKFLLCSIIILCSIIPNVMSQAKIKPYINVGYVTNLKVGEDSDKRDRGGSIRVGMLNKGLFGNGRFGFYGGYLWFNEFNLPGSEYDDRGSVLMAGIDLLALKKEKSNWYLKFGLCREKFISSYTSINLTESEINFKPDFGILYNRKNFNAYLGWQPSDPHHINIGIGYTLDRSFENKSSGY